MFVCTSVALRNIVISFQKRLCTAYVPKVWGAPGRYWSYGGAICVGDIFILN
jgi:hypothetical protein